MKQLLFSLFLISVLCSACSRGDQDTMTGTWRLHQYVDSISGTRGHEPDGLDRAVQVTFEDDGQTGTLKGVTSEHEFSGTYELTERHDIKILTFSHTGDDQNEWGRKFIWAMDRLNYFDVNTKNRMDIYFNREREKMKMRRVE